MSVWRVRVRGGEVGGWTVGEGGVSGFCLGEGGDEPMQEA